MDTANLKLRSFKGGYIGYRRVTEIVKESLAGALSYSKLAPVFI